jgi:L-asparaginase II
MSILDIFSNKPVVFKSSEDNVNPILVEDYRGDIVEKVHRGSLCLVNSLGESILSIGDTNAITYVRSAIKPIQILPMFAAKIDKRFSLTNHEIAVACSSHSGEMPHVNVIEKWLKRAGYDKDSLSLGAVPPMSRDALLGLFKMDEVYSKLHNPCSGIHTAILSICAAMRLKNAGYENSEHMVQKLIAKEIEYFTGIEHEKLSLGVDGCGMPAYAMSICVAAKAVAKFSDYENLDADRKVYAKKIIDACIDQPDMIAGTGRFDTEFTKYAKTAVAKSGADGVQAIYLPEQKMGLFVKIDDGDYRAAHTIAMKVIKQLQIMGNTAYSALEIWENPLIKNSRGKIVGKVLATNDVLNAISKIKL